MKWYLYAFAAGRPDGLPRGLGGRTVLVPVVHETCLLVSDWDEDQAPPLSAETALAHEGVIEAAMREVAVLPCRFGTLVDPEFCRGYVAAHSGSIRARLQRVSGQVEVTVKLFDRAEGGGAVCDNPPRSGTAYLLRKQMEVHAEQARSERVRRLADEIDSVLAPWATDRCREFTPGRGALVALSYLIPKEAVAPWAEAAAGLRGRFPAYDVLATGPWPPYHFAEVTPSGGGNAESHPGAACER